MNGGADLGGMHGFGPVVEEQNEPNFHARWEERAMAMVIATGACGQWNIDISRHARENMPPADYMTMPYYKIWIEGLEKLLVNSNMVASEEIKSGKMRIPPKPVPRILEASKVWDTLHSLAGSADRATTSQPVFAKGQKVKTININPKTHTRLPRYARGKSGVISKVLGHHVFADHSAHHRDEKAHWLYQVKFAARELWGSDANLNDSVTLDLWEPHFEQS